MTHIEMSNIDLNKLEQKARAAINDKGFSGNAMRRFWSDATPQTILALIERIRDAEEALEWYAQGMPWDDNIADHREKAKTTLEKWRGENEQIK